MSPAKQRTRADGERSRRTILDAAARLATVEGLEGLSIGRLAQAIGMSKSGLYAHFESKQELQLATIAAADEVFAAEVVQPAMAATEGLPRLEQLCDRFLSYVERDVFPGGCFFASTSVEWGARPGPVKDRIVASYTGWTDLLEANIRRAQEQGELDGGLDSAQVNFELNALLNEANCLYVLYGDAAAIDRARTGMAARLAR